MWAVNYIKWATWQQCHYYGWLSTYDANGALMFYKTYWKQRFNCEITFHGGLDDIHDEIYHWYAGQYNFGLVEKIEGLTWYIIKRPWTLHTHGFVDIFPEQLFCKISFKILFSPIILPTMLRGGGGVLHHLFLPWGSISVTKCDQDTAFNFFQQKEGFIQIEIVPLLKKVLNLR